MREIHRFLPVYPTYLTTDSDNTTAAINAYIPWLVNHHDLPQ